MKKTTFQTNKRFTSDPENVILNILFVTYRPPAHPHDHTCPLAKYEQHTALVKNTQLLHNKLLESYLDLKALISIFYAEIYFCDDISDAQYFKTSNPHGGTSRAQENINCNIL